ncbi:MAG TPA: amidohydrolase family protein [Hyphomicrobiaceae bacterium]|jgi:predicted TIM-barrel fold metal-dependent hydrolase|nr:amidohydrolase family protein [Hyphomicrobiaceae bacterium]
MSIYTKDKSPHYSIRPAWLALHDEPVLEPERPIVDPHHHLWDRPESRYLFLDLLDDLGTGHNLQATVFMECGAMYRRHGPEAERPVGEMEFAAGSAAMSDSGNYGDCAVNAAIIGSGDLRLGDDLGRILELYRSATGGRLRGVRQIAAWHRDPAARGSMANPAPGLLLEPVAERGLAAIEAAGLSFDVFAYHTQLDELVKVARRHPGLAVIVNHIGGAIGIGPYAGRRDEVFSDWRAGMVELGHCPNVRVKLSGLGMRLFGFGFGDRAQPPSSSDLATAWAPYVEACIEIFGADRCMFASNFPVDKGTCSYPVLWNAFKRIAAGASAGQKQALFAGTARQVYRLADQAQERAR